MLKEIFDSINRERIFRIWLPHIKKMTYRHTIQQFMGWSPPTFSDEVSGIFMEFTGFKDKNGQGIFEGDIVMSLKVEVKYVVVWMRHIGEYRLFPYEEGKPFTPPCAMRFHEIKEMVVLSNIFEDPDFENYT